MQVKSCQKVKTPTRNINNYAKKIINQYAWNRPGSDLLNVRLATKIRFAKSKFRAPHALYNLPTKKKENL